MKGLNFPEPFDGRKKLPRNSGGNKWKNRDVKSLEGLVWHQAQAWGSVENIAKYHTSKNSHLHEKGMESISYTWAIRRDGQIVLCNNFNKATWSQGYKGRTGDENAEFMSCCFEGYFRAATIIDSNAGEPNDRQILSAMILWNILKEHWNWGSGDLYGHHLFGKPYCPGDTLKGVIEAVRTNSEKSKKKPRSKIDLSSIKGRQRALKKLKYYKGPIDGLWGTGSRQALLHFQDDAGLVADGIWGPNTERTMEAALKKK